MSEGMDRVPLGIIGCGGMGRRHIRAYRALRDVGADRFEIKAVCDTRPEAAAAERTWSKNFRAGGPPCSVIFPRCSRAGW